MSTFQIDSNLERNFASPVIEPEPQANWSKLMAVVNGGAEVTADVVNRERAISERQQALQEDIDADAKRKQDDAENDTYRIGEAAAKRLYAVKRDPKILKDFYTSNAESSNVDISSAASTNLVSLSDDAKQLEEDAAKKVKDTADRVAYEAKVFVGSISPVIGKFVDPDSPASERLYALDGTAKRTEFIRVAFTEAVKASAGAGGLERDEDGNLTDVNLLQAIEIETQKLVDQAEQNIFIKDLRYEQETKKFQIDNITTYKYDDATTKFKEIEKLLSPDELKRLRLSPQVLDGAASSVFNSIQEKYENGEVSYEDAITEGVDLANYLEKHHGTRFEPLLRQTMSGISKLVAKREMPMILSHPTVDKIAPIFNLIQYESDTGNRRKIDSVLIDRLKKEFPGIKTGETIEDSQANKLDARETLFLAGLIEIKNDVVRQGTANIPNQTRGKAVWDIPSLYAVAGLPMTKDFADKLVPYLPTSVASVAGLTSLQNERDGAMVPHVMSKLAENGITQKDLQEMIGVFASNSLDPETTKAKMDGYSRLARADRAIIKDLPPQYYKTMSSEIQSGDRESTIRGIAKLDQLGGPGNPMIAQQLGSDFPTVNAIYSRSIRAVNNPSSSLDFMGDVTALLTTKSMGFDARASVKDARGFEGLREALFTKGDKNGSINDQFAQWSGVEDAKVILNSQHTESLMAAAWTYMKQGLASKPDDAWKMAFNDYKAAGWTFAKEGEDVFSLIYDPHSHYMDEDETDAKVRAEVSRVVATGSFEEDSWRELMKIPESLKTSGWTVWQYMNYGNPVQTRLEDVEQFTAQWETPYNLKDTKRYIPAEVYNQSISNPGFAERIIRPYSTEEENKLNISTTRPDPITIFFAGGGTISAGLRGGQRLNLFAGDVPFTISKKSNPGSSAKVWNTPGLSPGGDTVN